MKRKNNLELVETIIKSKKNNKWLEVARILSGPKRISINIGNIEEETKEGDIIVVPGKVLSEGDISKKIRIVALNFSDKAKEKLNNKKCEIVTILEEIKVNPKGDGIKILK